MNTTSIWRRVGAAAVVAVAPAVVAWTAAAWRDRLPDPMPTHWNGRLPDGYTSYGTFTTQLLVATLLPAALAIAVHAVARANPLTRHLTVAVAGGWAWLFLGVWLATAGAAWDSADAQTVELGWWVLLAAAGLGFGAVAAWLAYGRTPGPVRTARRDGDLPLAELAAGARAVWVRRVSAPTFLLMAAVLVVAAGVIMLLGGPPAVAVVVLASAVLPAALGSVRVVVDRHGLTVSSALLGWPRRRHDLADIERADAIILRPTEWGGWGYRVLPGRSAVVLRGGEALVVDLADGRQFAVTVEDARTGAGVLNALTASASEASAGRSTPG